MITFRKTRQQILKEKLEKRFLEEKKTKEEISQELDLPIEVIDSLLKFFRMYKTKELKKESKKIQEEIDKKRTPQECAKEFRRLKKKLKRTPMLLELPRIGKSGLRRDILKHYGNFSKFLKENRIGKPVPKKNKKRAVNFKTLASESAIRYHQSGKWSGSEKKIAKILTKMGLIENLDWWHNFKLASPSRKGATFQLDFYLPRLKIVIEVDSFWHDLGESKAKDALRDSWVKEYLGCETIRFDTFGQKGLAKIRKILKERLGKTL